VAADPPKLVKVRQSLNALYCCLHLVVFDDLKLIGFTHNRRPDNNRILSATASWAVMWRHDAFSPA
jgi:hypothetical protein